MKHLLEKYKKNETSEEETQIVEQQLMVQFFAKQERKRWDEMLTTDNITRYNVTPEAAQDIEERVMTQFFAKQERERWDAMLAADGITRDKVTANQAATTLTGTLNPKPNKMRTWWAAAASIALLIGVALLMPAQPTRKATANLQQKTDSYIKKRAAAPQTRMGSGSGLPADQIWEVAKNAYTEGNFDKVIAEIEKIGEDISPEQRYYLAQAYLAKENFPKAIENLSKVAKEEGMWTVEARWYLALAYIKNNQSDLAKPILETFVTKNWRNQQAKELLEDMK